MSLDITVKPHYKDYVLNKNHKITHDEFEEMIAPDKNDFAYVTHPKHLAKDEKIYDDIEKWFSKQEDHLPSFHLTYRQFFMLRNIILSNAGVKFIDNQTNLEIKKPVPDTMDYSWYWNPKDIFNPESNQAIDFLTKHSDCDGDYPEEEVDHLDYLLHDYPLTKENKEFLVKHALLDKYNDFVKFIRKAFQNHDALIFY